MSMINPKSGLAAAVLLVLAASAASRLAGPSASHERAIVRTAPATMPLAEEGKVAGMERLLAQSKAMPASAYTKLPDETTPTESKLMQVLAYLQNVRPTDGGDGPTGAIRIGRLVQDAGAQYRVFLGRRLATLAPGAE